MANAKLDISAIVAEAVRAALAAQAAATNPEPEAPKRGPGRPPKAKVEEPKVVEKKEREYILPEDLFVEGGSSQMVRVNAAPTIVALDISTQAGPEGGEYTGERACTIVAHPFKGDAGDRFEVACRTLKLGMTRGRFPRWMFPTAHASKVATALRAAGFNVVIISDWYLASK